MLFGKVIAMDRLTAEDRLILWPDEVWPQDIGALAVLDGSSMLDAGGFRIEAVREAIEGRLHLLPRFRQLLYEPRRGLGGPGSSWHPCARSRAAGGWSGCRLCSWPARRRA